MFLLHTGTQPIQTTTIRSKTMYTTTIKITQDMIEQIEDGSLKIKCGQWVQYAWMSKKSRFVGVTKAGSIWAVHSCYGKFCTQAQSIKKFQ